MIGCATYSGRPIGDDKTVALAPISTRQTFGLSVPWPSCPAPLSTPQGCRPISDQGFRMADLLPLSRHFGRSVTIDWAYQWRYSGQSVTKTSAYQWLSSRPIGDSPTKNLSQTQGLGHPFLTITRTRDLNLELTLLTPTQPAGSTGGYAPLAPFIDPASNATKSPPLRGLRPLPAQTQPTRQTPARTPYGHPQNIQLPRAASGGGKMQTVMKPVAVLYPALLGLRFTLTPMAMMKSAHPSPISQTRPLRGRGAKRTLTGAGLTG